MAAEWTRVKQVFERAIELVGEARVSYLDEACAGDRELRAEVEQLLSPATTIEIPERTDEPAPDAVFEPGEVLAGRFEIRRMLGRGGMGQVYLARDRRLGGEVALKTLRPDLLYYPRTRERFKHEILLARRVTHPNICRIYDLVTSDTGSADVSFTMELLKGVTLGEFIRRKGRLTTGEALPLVRGMAAGLEALHQEGIVHRDFKPGNVMLDESREGPTRVKITDFGLARREVPEEEATNTQASKEVAGTPRYMSPEQLAGKPVTAASDIYALGVVMYEMVTGRAPCESETLGASAVEKMRPPLPPSRLAPDLDPVWETTILACLRADPQQRPARVTDVVTALAGVSVKADGPDPHRRLTRWLAIVAVLVALVVAVARFAGVPKQDTGPARVRHHVAVLPFAVRGDDARLQVLGDGLMGTITRRLSQFEGVNEDLLVIPASEVTRRGVKVPADALKWFHTNYVVEGSLEEQGKQIRLVLTVVDTGHKPMQQLDTAVISDRKGNAFSLEDGAVARLARLLALRPNPQNTDRAALLSLVAPAAREFYLEGRGYLERSDKTENIDHAAHSFQQALEVEPSFVLAEAGLGEADWRMYERTKDSQWAARAVEVCNRASSSEFPLPEVEITLGNVNNGTGRYAEAIAHFQQALATDVRSAEAFMGLGMAYSRLGRLEAAEATYRKAISLRPEDWRTYQWLSGFYFDHKNYEAAIEPCRKVVALTPDNALGYQRLGAALQFTGRIEEAKAAYEHAVRIHPSAGAYSNLGKILTEAGELNGAVRRYEEALAVRDTNYLIWGNLGYAYSRMNDPRAVEAFRKAANLLAAALEVNPKRDELYSKLASYYAGAGNKEKAWWWLAKAARRASPDTYEFVSNAATAEKIGRRKQALEWLGRALAEGYPAETLKQEVWLSAVLEEPEYRRLLASSGGE